MWRKKKTETSITGHSGFDQWLSERNQNSSMPQVVTTDSPVGEQQREHSQPAIIYSQTFISPSDLSRFKLYPEKSDAERADLLRRGTKALEKKYSIKLNINRSA